MRLRLMNVAAAALGALALALAGCGSAPAGPPPAQAPADFALTLFTAEPPSLKYTWFELTSAGELLYAGGRDATTRHGQRAATLTPAQRQEIWDILLRGKLHDAPAGPLFPTGERITYDFTLNTGGFDKIVRAADDQQPALKELHDYLYGIQKKRYAE